MADRTDPLARSIHGSNPQFLISKIIRDKIYSTVYWKKECFALNAETIIDKAIALTYIGGTYGGSRKPTPFLCLILKLLQIQPEESIVIEYINNGAYKYLTVLGAFYLRLTGRPLDIYNQLESLLSNYNKIRERSIDGGYVIRNVDDIIDQCLTEDTVMDIDMPALPKRQILVDAGLLKLTRKSALDDDFVNNQAVSDGNDHKVNKDKSRELPSPSLSSRSSASSRSSRSNKVDGSRSKKRTVADNSSGSSSSSSSSSNGIGNSKKTNMPAQRDRSNSSARYARGSKTGDNRASSSVSRSISSRRCERRSLSRSPYTGKGSSRTPNYTRRNITSNSSNNRSSLSKDDDNRSRDRAARNDKHRRRVEMPKHEVKNGEYSSYKGRSDNKGYVSSGSVSKPRRCDKRSKYSRTEYNDVSSRSSSKSNHRHKGRPEENHRRRRYSRSPVGASEKRWRERERHRRSKSRSMSRGSSTSSMNFRRTRTSEDRKRRKRRRESR